MKGSMFAVLRTIVIACLLCGSPAQAQLFSSIVSEIPTEALASGDPTKGIGFAALRYEDKKRLKRLRERYLELNPKRRGVVTVYDVDTGLPQKEDEAVPETLMSAEDKPNE